MTRKTVTMPDVGRRRQSTGMRIDRIMELARGLPMTRQVLADVFV